jgi:hypothetical protein
MTLPIFAVFLFGKHSLIYSMDLVFPCRRSFLGELGKLEVAHVIAALEAASCHVGMVKLQTDTARSEVDLCIALRLPFVPGGRCSAIVGVVVDRVNLALSRNTQKSHDEAKRMPHHNYIYLKVVSVLSWASHLAETSVDTSGSLISDRIHFTASS